MDIFAVEVFPGHVKIEYADGSREEVENGVYERKNADRDTVEERVATDADLARLADLAAAFQVENPPSTAAVVEVEVIGTSIEIKYADGTKEEIKGGVYELKDADNETILERAATEADVARLNALATGGTTSDVPLPDPATIAKVEIFGDDIQVDYADGSKEEIEAGRYERKDANNQTIEERTATADDIARLQGLAGGADPAVVTFEYLLADGTRIETGVGKIEVTYPDGTREEIEASRYERKDANNETVEERLATQEDIDRLSALLPEGTTAPDISTGTPTGADLTDDDGTPDQGSGDAPGTPGSGGSADDDGTPDQGSGDAPGTPGSDPVEPDPAPVVPTISGTEGRDRIKGTNDDDVIEGLAGNDRLHGRNGDDVLDSGDGNDRARGGNGDDTVNGGAGNDRVRGDNGNDIVSGGSGNDDVRGDRGDDIVDGGDGNDRVRGGDGDDIVDGGAGSDRYWGGLGADTFVFAADGASDKIHDFEDGIDLVDLTAYGFADANEALSFAYEHRGNTYFNFGDGDMLKVDSVQLTNIEAADLIL